MNVDTHNVRGELWTPFIVPGEGTDGIMWSRELKDLFCLSRCLIWQPITFYYCVVSMVIWFGRLNGWYSQVYSCVCLPGGNESMSAWGEQQEEGNKRGNVNNREEKSGINHIRPLEEIIWQWREECRRSGVQMSRQSCVLMQNRLLTLLLASPSPSLCQDVMPNADRKHSINLHACGSRAYLYPIIVARFKEPGNLWGQKDKNLVPL